LIALARILLFKSCKYGKAPKVLASRTIRVFGGKEIYKKKKKKKTNQIEEASLPPWALIVIALFTRPPI
jgi:hypothetical protein